jgi:hypothetical protein
MQLLAQCVECNSTAERLFVYSNENWRLTTAEEQRSPVRVLTFGHLKRC